MNESRTYNEGFWPVPPMWEGETVFVIGGGASLADWDVAGAALPRQGRVLAINNGWELEPWADMLYFADRDWFDWNKHKLLGFLGQHLVSRTFLRPDQLGSLETRYRYVGRDWGQPLSLATNKIAGWCSGANALNICYHARAKRVVLLGFDMRGNGNWHNNHRVDRPTFAYVAKHQLPSILRMSIALLGAGHKMEILNATPGSAITAFPMVDPRDFGIERKHVTTEANRV